MYPGTFKYSLPDFLAIIKKLKMGNAIVDGLGGAIRETDISDSQVNNSMWDLARRGGGKIISSLQDFFFALNGEASKVKFVDAAAYVLVESAKDVAVGAQAVGNQLILTGKILTFLLPVIVLGAVYFYLDGKSGGKLGRALK
jgi:hypothetical protein